MTREVQASIRLLFRTCKDFFFVFLYQEGD